MTRPEDAQACAALGADALGFVFHVASPRHVTPEQARGMVGGLPRHVAPVGVFVQQAAAEIVAVARVAGLRTVQLHGPAMPDTAPLRAAGLRIVRVLFDLTPPDSLPDADAFLIECGRGARPGGNGRPWDWAAAAALIAALPRPCGLAGGLAPDNVAAALRRSGAAAADAVSSTETAPGAKNLDAVRRFVAAVHAVTASPPEPVF